MNFYPPIRRLLFLLDPERAHQLTLKLLGLAGALPPIRVLLRSAFSYTSDKLPVKVFGLEFPNRVGLAAGYDKDGLGMHGLSSLGFGHLELGTVTPQPQMGNPRPRIFRLPEDHALINRMGFPNAGAERLIHRLKQKRPKGVVLGVNIGKGVDTPIEHADQDYISLMRSFYSLSDYLAVNISSPNTIGLRRLQARDHLEKLLASIMAEKRLLHSTTDHEVPVLIKLAPDLSEDELQDAIQVILDTGMDGIIATNTTISRDGLRSRNRSEAGGLSGTPLHTRAVEIVTKINQLTNGNLPIIGVGGINGVRETKAMLGAGASLIQLYTGLVYQGPGVVKEILMGLENTPT
jgi:dihydroorotate dehydrogenase